MRPLEIKKDIWWVGAVDWNGRDFHGYAKSPEGTTYNAYFIKDEKNVMIDSVKSNFSDRLIENVSRLTPMEKVDYLVVNHLEPDHSGCLPRIVELTKPEKIFCSPMGEKAMKAHFHYTDWPVEVVKSGDEVSIGKRTLKFFETRMLHWPDNMLTYVPEEKLAISSDAFGQNWATSERFADEVDRTKLKTLLADYYANIVLPYSPQVTKTLDSLAELGLDIDMLCPDHGLMFRGEDVAFALNTYRELAEQKPKKKAVIVFDTMWHSTEKMGLAIADGLVDEGVSVKILSMPSNHHSRVMNEVYDAAAVCVGSPTHNNGILPGMADMLTYMKGLRPQGKIGAAFGSFGWSGECVKILTEWLELMKMDIVEPPVKVKNVPDTDALDECYEYGRKIGRAICEKLGS